MLSLFIMLTVFLPIFLAGPKLNEKRAKDERTIVIHQGNILDPKPGGEKLISKEETMADVHPKILVDTVRENNLLLKLLVDTFVNKKETMTDLYPKIEGKKMISKKETETDLYPKVEGKKIIGKKETMTDKNIHESSTGHNTNVGGDDEEVEKADMTPINVGCGLAGGCILVLCVMCCFQQGGFCKDYCNSE